MIFLPLQGNQIARSWLFTFWRYLAKLSHPRRTPRLGFLSISIFSEYHSPPLFCLTSFSFTSPSRSFFGTIVRD